MRELWKQPFGEPKVVRPVSEIAQRMFHPWRAGDRCRAVVPIVYGMGASDVEEGSYGVVEDVSGKRILSVRWDGRPDALATSPDCVGSQPS